MVTLGNTQNLSEFELHARAILGLDIPEIKQIQHGASVVILSEIEKNESPIFTGLEQAFKFNNTDVRLFGKPTCRKYRRMGVVLTFGDEDVKELVEKGKKIAKEINVH
jgi:phosphoribosylglycinamide formyltransferase 2